MKVLITGGAGFIGSHVAQIILSNGHQVTVLDNLTAGRLENIPVDAAFIKADITTPELPEILLKEKPDTVIHLAAQVDVASSLSDPLTDAKTNITGTINLLEACRKTRVSKVIYSSSAAVYGDPIDLPLKEDSPVAPKNPYGISKYVSEMYLRLYFELYNLNYTILRYANVYGPRQEASGEGGVVAIFLGKLLRSESPVIYGNGEQTRDFVFVKDIARANLLALESGNGCVMNVGTNATVTINELFILIKRLANCDVGCNYAPARPGDIMHNCLDNKRVRDTLGWEPKYLLVEGLTETIKWGIGMEQAHTEGGLRDYILEVDP
ncbi:MAG: NAD-dependent epimerase/dehydratase family protein [Bacillota bacterium]